MKVLALTPDASLLLHLLANEIERDLELVIEPSLRAGLARLDEAPWALVFVDSNVAQANRTLDVVDPIACAGHRVVLLARAVSVELVIEALRRGVWDLLQFPLSAVELRNVIARSRRATMPSRKACRPSNASGSRVTTVGAALPDVPGDLPAARDDGAERRVGRDRRQRADRRSRSKPLPPLEVLERDHISKALKLTGGQIGRAADLLGIHRNTLRRKLREFRLAAELPPNERREESTSSGSMPLEPVSSSTASAPQIDT
jgi:DNA-binding NtrC family response regulator